MSNSFKPSSKLFKNTFCVFQEVATILIADMQPDFKSESGSHYFFTKEGMYRLSNHWGRLANSKWHLNGLPENTSKIKLGFAKWEHFYPDNSFEQLYYLAFDPIKNIVTYEHKNNPNYDGKAVVRTAKETTKRIKHARNILYLSNWASYFNVTIDLLRQEILAELLYSDTSLDEIKRKIASKLNP